MPLICVTDSKSLFYTVHTLKIIDDSRMKIDTAVLRDHLRQNEMQKITWVESASQLAASLTKTGASSSKLVDAFRGKYQPNC